MGLLTLLTPGAARAFTFSFDESSDSSNTTPTGASATVDFRFINKDNNVLLELDITNTTDITNFGAGATRSKFTGLGFDILDGLTVNVASYDPGNPTYLPILKLNDSLAPFGTFDVAILDNKKFEGGNANAALPEGTSTTVSFELITSVNASTLEAEFFDAFANGNLQAVARFQQVNAGEGSDKLLGGTIIPDGEYQEVPEPGAAGAMALLALGAITYLKKRNLTLTTHDF